MSGHRDKRSLKVNATERLSKFLDAMDHTESAQNVAAVLSSVLQIKTDDPNRSELLAFSVITKMIESAEVEAQRVYSDEWEIVGPHFAGIRRCFAPHSSGANWNQYKQNLTVSDLTGLRHTAVHLKRHVSEKFLEPDDMQEVVAAVDRMSEALQDEKLSAHTRLVLQERLAAIRKAMDEYRFWGMAGIDLAYREFVGTLVTDLNVRSDTQKGDNPHVWKTVKEVIVTLSALVTLATGIVNLGQKAVPLIERLMIEAPLTDSVHAASPIGEPPPTYTVKVESVGNEIA